jgi:hypothetical protein
MNHDRPARSAYDNVCGQDPANWMAWPNGQTRSHNRMPRGANYDRVPALGQRVGATKG